MPNVWADIYVYIKLEYLSLSGMLLFSMSGLVTSCYDYLVVACKFSPNLLILKGVKFELYG